MEIVQHIFTDQIDEPKGAMRSDLDRDALFELADNIKQNGLINPITVRPCQRCSATDACDVYKTLGMCDHGSRIRYEVVAGHRRLNACKIAGILKIACVIRNLTDQETFAVMAAENLERADVDAVDEANFIRKYIEQTNQSVAEVAKSLRRSVGYVESRLAVGDMPDYMQAYVKTGQLKLGAALALVQIDSEKQRRVWTEMAARDGVSVAQAEFWLHGYLMNKLPGGTMDENPPEGFVPGVSAPIMFECALDGKKYDARLFKVVMLYEGNIELFNQIVAELRVGVGALEE